MVEENPYDPKELEREQKLKKMREEIIEDLEPGQTFDIVRSKFEEEYARTGYGCFSHVSDRDNLASSAMRVAMINAKHEIRRSPDFDLAEIAENVRKTLGFRIYRRNNGEEKPNSYMFLTNDMAFLERILKTAITVSGQRQPRGSSILSGF